MIILVVIAAAVVFFLFGMYKAAKLRKRRRERVARVELASAEAAGDDAYFAADLVKQRGGRAAPRDRRGLDRPRPRRARRATSAPTC